MVHEFPVSSRDVTYQIPPGQEYFSYDVIIPAQGEFGSDIPAGDGKLSILFLRCVLHNCIARNSNSLGQLSMFGALTPFFVQC